MLDGCDEVDDFYKSQALETKDAKSIPQRGSMPTGVQEADRVIARLKCSIPSLEWPTVTRGALTTSLDSL